MPQIPLIGDKLGQNKKNPDQNVNQGTASKKKQILLHMIKKREKDNYFDGDLIFPMIFLAFFDRWWGLEVFIA